MSRLWFDDADIRGCPRGWKRAKDVDEAIEIIKTGEVEEMSLDHDIEIPCYASYSTSPPNGTDLVYWMLRNLPPLQWPHTIRIHTMSRSGAERMEGLLLQAAPNFVQVKVRRYETSMIEELSIGEEDGQEKK